MACGIAARRRDDGNCYPSDRVPAKNLQFDRPASEPDLAPWHIENPGLVANALQHAYGVAPHLNLLARLVIPRMARLLLATSTLKTAQASSGRMPLDEAITHHHLGVRTEHFAYAVAVDCDHAGWPEALEELCGYGVPRPTWIAVDPWTGRAHLVWWIRDPVLLTDKGRAAPRELLDTVRRMLTAAVGGDKAFAGTLTKNPWGVGRPMSRYGTPAMPALWDAHCAQTPELRHSVVMAPALHTLADLQKGLAVC
jgi:hypothetical protein